MNLFSKVESSSVMWFAVYDIEKMEGNDHIVVYYSPTEETKDEQLRKIGLIEGIRLFNKSFDKDELDFIELDDSKIVVKQIGSKVLVLSIKLTKLSNDDNDEIKLVDDESISLRFLKLCLEQGHEYCLLLNNGIDEQFWIKYIKNFELQLNNNGFMKLFDSIRISDMKFDINILKELKPNLYYEHFYIFNNDLLNFENNGIMYKDTLLNLENERILINWIQLHGEHEFKHWDDGIIVKEENTGPKNEIIYDPFKLVFNTISDVSSRTGVSTTLNTSVGLLKSTLPTWMGGGVHTEESTATSADTEENYHHPNDLFLVKQKIYFNNEEFKLILSKHEEFCCVLIVKPDVEINESQEWIINKINYDLNKESINNNTKPKTAKSFYYTIIKNEEIFSNFPFIPALENNELNLTSRKQSLLVNRELLKTINFNGKEDENEREKLIRLSNNWFIYFIYNEFKKVIIVKRVNNNELQNGIAIINNEIKSFINQF